MDMARMVGLWIVSASVVGCGSTNETQAPGEVFMELDGEELHFQLQVSEVGAECEQLREQFGDDAVEQCKENALVAYSLAGDGEAKVGINVGLCRGLSEASSVDLGDSTRTCQPSGVLVTRDNKALTASSGSIEVTIDDDIDVLVDAMVDDATDAEDEPVRVQAHLILEP